MRLHLTRSRIGSDTHPISQDVPREMNPEPGREGALGGGGGEARPVPAVEADAHPNAGGVSNPQQVRALCG